MTPMSRTNSCQLSKSEAAICLARIRSDTQLQVRFRRAYTGDGDALDQLEWLIDPSMVASSGATNPSDELAPLQKLVYGQNGAGGATQAARELETLRQRISFNVAAVSEALLALAEPASDTDEPTQPPREFRSPDRPRLLRRRSTSLPIALASIVSIGLIVQATTPPPMSFVVFAREQSPTEAALEQSLSLEFWLNNGSLRLLAVQDENSLLSFTSKQGILPAMAGLDSVCLVVENSTRFYPAGCAAVQELKSAGLSGTVELADGVYRYRWGPRGTASFSEAPSSSAPSDPPIIGVPTTTFSSHCSEYDRTDPECEAN